MTEPATFPSGDPTAPRPSGPDWYTDLLTPTAASAPRHTAGFVATTIAVVILLIVGGGAVVAMSGQQSNTPEGAVRGLLDAAGNGDALGVLDHLDPPERDPLAGFLTSGADDLKRLGIASPALQLGHIAGVNLTFAGITTATSDLRPGLAAVKVTGGTVHRVVNPTQLPLGPFTHDVAGKALAAAKPSDRTDPVHSDTAIVTIRRGDTWYVSLGYTIAEAARAAAKAPMPTASQSIPAVGADSATGAVDAFLRAAAALDVNRLIELTPPDETGALHDYAALFLPKATDAIAKMRSGPSPVTVEVSDLELSSKSHAGGELVKITRLGLRVTVGGSTIDLAPGSRCFTVTGTMRTFPDLCGAPNASAAAAAALTGPFKALTGIRPEVGIMAVKVGNHWFVSPLRTVLDDAEATLHALTPDAMQSLKTLFNPASLFGLGSATVPSGPGAVTGITPARLPTVGPCVDGTRTITFPAVPGAVPLAPVKAPCPPTPVPHR